MTYFAVALQSDRTWHTQALEGSWIGGSHCGSEEDRVDTIRFGEGTAAIPSVAATSFCRTLGSIALHEYAERKHAIIFARGNCMPVGHAQRTTSQH